MCECDDEDDEDEEHEAEDTEDEGKREESDHGGAPVDKDLVRSARDAARFKRRETSDGVEADLTRELVTAVSGGDVVTVRELLERGVPADACLSPSKSAWSLLHVSCTEGRGDKRVVELLLDFGADPNATTTDGMAPLHFCAMESHIECARVLLDGGADPNKLDSEGLNPLLRACMARKVQFELADLLIKRGTRVDYADPEGWTALHMAARYSLDRVAALVLSSGAPVDMVIPSNQWTPLMLCCTEGAGSRSILEMLIKAGASVENRSDVSITALHIACYNNYPELVGLLLDAGADTSVRDKHGRSVLHKACLAAQPSLASARILVERGVDARARDNQGQTPLHYAAIAGSEPFCKLLLMRDSSRGRNTKQVLVDMEDEKGRTPLLAVCEGPLDAPSVVRLLLSYGADATHTDNSESSALNLAVRAGNLGAVQMLLEQAPYDINHPDEDCRTPLHLALAGQSEFDPSLFTLLLEHDADFLDAGIPRLDRLNGSQLSSPLLAAVRKDHIELVQRLCGTKPPRQSGLAQCCPQGHDLQPFAGAETFTCDVCCLPATFLGERQEYSQSPHLQRLATWALLTSQGECGPAASRASTLVASWSSSGYAEHAITFTVEPAIRDLQQHFGLGSAEIFFLCIDEHARKAPSHSFFAFQRVRSKQK
ncbi:Ankyrin repeat domain-containing protein 50 [Hondaea fermentalgiana]|uniref:Ankyrin repeat domain-containing protein 50 n=1 Tax=Hondaea fermentalgiana TaxID=2315210 RepID=A0A2R5H084_9STRA|nr:Ankyrin repeat domain-containing protein 50 [Hondaea fermentalgiana]|eukprot:GBG34463.1 Ankyrin repeat domain-containing protein 50 [Hondaea fermentalgiana]